MRTRLSIALLMVLAFGLSAAAQSTEHKTVWNGVYSSAQAKRGQEAYTANCSRCHGETLEGTSNNALEGPDFMDRWREDNVESLFLFIRSSMPLQRNRNIPKVQLPDGVYLDIISYVMQANSWPAGNEELKADKVAGIQIEGRDGPKPLPNGAVAAVAGCMVQEGNAWVLNRATEPIRTRSSDMTTADEVTAFQGKSAGGLTFKLANFGYLGPDFKPEEHAGQRVVVKGTLVRQLGAERISLTSVTGIGMCK